MKGFKKDGKFRPTSKRSKSSLSKDDLKDKKYHVNETANAEVLYSVKGKNEEDALENHLEGKSQEQDHIHTDIDLTVTKHGRDKVTLQEGLHRPVRENGKTTPLTPEQKQENIDALNENAHPVYVEMVKRFPNSSVGSDVNRWAESGLYGGHGHFGEALKSGDIESAMYRADSDNLVNLDEIGIDHLLSNTSNHPDDESARQDFKNRAEWARKHTGRHK